MSIKSTLRSFLYRKQGKAYFLKLREKGKTSRSSLTRWYCRHQYGKLMAKNNADISFGCQLGENPTFPHSFSGIYISEGAKIGKNCVIFHQVTIGSNTIPDSAGQGFPTLGDNVYIGCGAKIIGNVKIGSNVRIGANCVVTRDVPDNATVVLEKPRVILRENPQENRFVSFEETVKHNG